MNFLKRLFCKHTELKLWMPLEATHEYMTGIWECNKCGKQIHKTVEGDFMK